MARKANHGGQRPGAGRPRKERDDVTVKMDRALAAKAKYVAELMGVSLAEYVTEASRNSIERDFDKAVKGSTQPPKKEA